MRVRCTGSAICVCSIIEPVIHVNSICSGGEVKEDVVCVCVGTYVPECVCV